MASNCKVELSSFLGQDAKEITTDNKNVIALRIATTDSYKDEAGTSAEISMQVPNI